jgi:hypothetical protein
MAYVPIPTRMLDEMEIRLSNVIKQEGIHTRNTVVQEHVKTMQCMSNCLTTINQTINTFSGNIRDLDAEIRIVRKESQQANADHYIKTTNVTLHNVLNALAGMQYTLDHISIEIFELDQGRSHDGPDISKLEEGMEEIISRIRETGVLLREVVAQVPGEDVATHAAPDTAGNVCGLEAKPLCGDADLVWSSEKDVLCSTGAAISEVQEKIHEVEGVFSQLASLTSQEGASLADPALVRHAESADPKTQDTRAKIEYSSSGDRSGENPDDQDSEDEDLDGENPDGDEAHGEDSDSDALDSDGEVINLDIPYDLYRDEAMLRESTTRELAPEILRELENPSAAATLALADETPEEKTERLEYWIGVLKHYARLRGNSIRDMDVAIAAHRERGPREV